MLRVQKLKSVSCSNLSRCVDFLHCNCIHSPPSLDLHRRYKPTAVTRRSRRLHSLRCDLSATRTDCCNQCSLHDTAPGLVYYCYDSGRYCSFDYIHADLARLHCETSYEAAVAHHHPFGTLGMAPVAAIAVDYDEPNFDIAVEEAVSAPAAVARMNFVVAEDAAVAVDPPIKMF